MPLPAPLLERTPPEELGEPLHAAWERSMELRGDGTLFEVFGQHPSLYAWYADSFYGTLFTGGVAPRRLKELLRLRLSSQHGCRFCNQGNRADAEAAGIDAARIEAVATGDRAPFDPLERATLNLADRLALSEPDDQLDEALVRALRDGGLDDAQILELGMLAGLLTGMAKFLFTFDLVEREADCPFPAPPGASNDTEESR